MGAISATDIISIIQGEIENINWDEESRETGEVIWVGDGIVTVYGIDHAMYGEIVAFENGVKGMVQDVRQNEICSGVAMGRRPVAAWRPSRTSATAAVLRAVYSYAARV